MMATLTKQSKAGEVKRFLLVHIDRADEHERAKTNPSITRQDAWNVFMSSVIGRDDDEDVHHLAIRNMVREFGSYYESDKGDEE